MKIRIVKNIFVSENLKPKMNEIYDVLYVKPKLLSEDKLIHYTLVNEHKVAILKNQFELIQD